MTDDYFSRLAANTVTRMWVNNPTQVEAARALAAGAAGCTTNPAYGGGLVRRAPSEITPIIAESLGETSDAGDAADLIQLRLVQRLVELFAPLYRESRGLMGFVSIQGSPERDADGDAILQEARQARALGPNATPKIPATLPGFYALERLIADGSPTIITEVFSLDQLEYACETYLRVARAKAIRPPFFISPITGIFCDHLKAIAAREQLEINESIIDWAGVAFARRCQQFVELRGYPVTLLFGGARKMHDFTELVGAATAATVNFTTVEEIREANPPIGDTIHTTTDTSVLNELLRYFPDFWKGYEVGRLQPKEFETFGPVLHFRLNFVSGWTTVLEAIAAYRDGVALPA